MTIDIAILSAPVGGTRFPIATSDATGVTISDNIHGDEQLAATLPRTLVEGLAIYEAPIPQVVVSEHGAPIASYRLEQPAISDASLMITALGAGRAFSDIRLTALWSQTTFEGWRPATTQDSPGRLSERGEFDQQNRLFIAPKKGDSYSSTFVIAQTFETPVTQVGMGGRGITGVSFDYEFLAPVSWRAAFNAWSRDYSAQTPLWQLNSTGALQRGTVHQLPASVDRLEFAVNYTAAATVFAGETGSAYLKITNLRVVTSIDNRVNTTFTANRAAGVGVTATVGSTARMYAGQLLDINANNSPSETVTVQSVTSATQFVATFVNSYVIGNQVRGHVIYADEIARDALAQVAALNPNQLNSATAQIEVSNQRDLTDVAYADQPADAILSDLEQRTAWRWAVRNRLFSFAPVGTNAQAWYVDAATLEVQRALDALYNRAYAIYEDATGMTQRSVRITSTTSQQRFGILRVLAVSADTTNLTLAIAQRQAALTGTISPTPQASLTFDAVYTAGGVRVPAWMVHADDTLIIRNLPPQAAQSRDAIRVLVLTRREVNLDDGSVTVEAQPLETIERLIGRTTA